MESGNHSLVRSSVALRLSLSVLATLLVVGCASSSGRKQYGGDVLPIVSFGKGVTASEARDAAVLYAIEKAVGAYMFSETSLRDGELQEVITEFRAAVVEDLKVLQEVEGDDGLWTSRVLVYVNTRPITARLMGTSTIEGTMVDGEALARASLARNRARKQFLDDAESALTAILDGFPEVFMSLEPDGELEVTETAGGGSAHLKASYRLVIDFERYQEEMLPVLQIFFTEVGSPVGVHDSESFVPLAMGKVLLFGFLLGDSFDARIRVGRRDGERLIDWEPGTDYRVRAISKGDWESNLYERHSRREIPADRVPVGVLIASDFFESIWGQKMSFDFDCFAVDRALALRLWHALAGKRGPTRRLVFGLEVVSGGGAVLARQEKALWDQGEALPYSNVLDLGNIFLISPFPSQKTRWDGINHYSAQDIKIDFEFDLPYSKLEKMSKLRPTINGD